MATGISQSNLADPAHPDAGPSEYNAVGYSYFSRCGPCRRFICVDKSPATPLNDEHWGLYDWDQRRYMAVHLPFSDDPADETFVFKAVEKTIDSVPPGVLDMWMSNDGAPPSGPMIALDGDFSWGPFYPPRTRFGSEVPTVRRGELTECGRLGVQVDLTTYSPRPGETKTVVFKYNVDAANVAVWWHEANCVLHMPPHPNIVPFDALVLDLFDGVESVVGFTTRYIAGGTLFENKARVFKLRYLEQLISAVDHLNLHLGVVHGDICPWNLAIDAETDNIQLFDFNRAAKLGWEGDKAYCFAFKYEEDRNDVKLVKFTTHELITRQFCSSPDFQPHEFNVSQITIDLEQEWVQHEDAKLDSPMEEYKRVLDEWVKRRAEVKIDHFSKASTPLQWPDLVVDPFMYWAGAPAQLGRPRAVLSMYGREDVKWERPPTTSLPLPKGKRLLATGEIVTEDGGEGELGQGSGASGSPAKKIRRKRKQRG